MDIACGTGVVARLAAPLAGAAGTVVGVDINPGMLDVARSTTPPDVPIDWRQASAHDLPLPDRSFDVALCQMGLQFVADKPAAVREMHRILDSNGRLALNAPGPTPPALAVLADALARHVQPDLAKFVHVVFSLHDPDELRDLLETAQFREVNVEQQSKTLRLPPPEKFLWQYVHSTPLAGPVADTDDNTRTAIARDVVAGWEPFADKQGLTLEVDVLVATARKR